jgi:hypothetical protein
MKKDTLLNFLILILSMILVSLVSCTMNIKKIDNNSKLLESIYDSNTNTFSVTYIRNNKDTVGLDYLKPKELDSLVKTLNPTFDTNKLINPPN